MRVFDETENKETCIQPVIKQNAESDFSAQISALEEEARELRTLIKKEAYFSTNINKNQWARPDSDRRPPPCQDGVFEALSSIF